MNAIERKIYEEYESQNYVPFHQKLNIIEALCSEGELHLIHYRHEEKLLGILPYYLKKKLPYSYITHPPMIKWMGPMLVEGCQNPEMVIQKLMDGIPNVAYFEQNFYYDVLKRQLAEEWSLDFQDKYSYVIENIQDLDAVFKNIHPVYRNNKIRKAEKLVHLSLDGTIEEFLSVHHQSFTRQGITYPVSEKALKTHISNVIDREMGILLFAKDAFNQIYSVAFMVWDEKKAYLHMSGDDIELRKSGSGIFLTWEAIKYASEVLGLEEFDFEGSMLPNVEQVRKRFGAVKNTYGKIIRYNSRSFKLLQSLKSS